MLKCITRQELRVDWRLMGTGMASSSNKDVDSIAVVAGATDMDHHHHHGVGGGHGSRSSGLEELVDRDPELGDPYGHGLGGMSPPDGRNKPRIAWEVRPFTRESLEKINLRTSNLIRDYGFLPRRQPNILDGAQLPAKYEPFPPELLGKPVEELDTYVYEKVGHT